MFQTFLLSYLRRGLLAVGVGLVTKGYMDAGTVEIVAGAIITGISAAWTDLSVNTKNAIVTRAAALPEVTSVRSNDPELQKAAIKAGATGGTY